MKGRNAEATVHEQITLCAPHMPDVRLSQWDGVLFADPRDHVVDFGCAEPLRGYGQGPAGGVVSCHRRPPQAIRVVHASQTGGLALCGLALMIGEVPHSLGPNSIWRITGHLGRHAMKTLRCHRKAGTCFKMWNQPRLDLTDH